MTSLPADFLTSGPVAQFLGDLPFNPSLARLTLTCRALFHSRVAAGKRVAGLAARAAAATLDRRVVLLVVHTQERRAGAGKGAIVDLRQNFLMNITSTTDLAHVYGALDKRLRVSANAMTQCKRPRPCGQAVALGYTSVRPSRLKLSRRDTGAPLGRSGPCAPLVDDATDLDGAASRAFHANLHLEADQLAMAHLGGGFVDDSSDDEDDDPAMAEDHTDDDDEPDARN